MYGCARWSTSLLAWRIPIDRASQIGRAACKLWEHVCVGGDLQRHEHLVLCRHPPHLRRRVHGLRAAQGLHHGSLRRALPRPQDLGDEVARTGHAHMRCGHGRLCQECGGRLRRSGAGGRGAGEGRYGGRRGPGRRAPGGDPARDRSLAIKPADFDVTSGHDISKFLRQNSKLACRGKALVEICRTILNQKGNERTKIIVFADGRIGAGAAARDFLCAEADLGCTWLDVGDNVEEKNKKISWYQNADVTAEDRARPRVLVLNFEHAAGLNLQTESNNLILFSPLYVGEGGTSGDAVADASTELQAIGRVYRPGQNRQEVHVYRIEVRGQKGEECLDGHLIRRNNDKDTVAMATNAAD